MLTPHLHTHPTLAYHHCVLFSQERLQNSADQGGLRKPDVVVVGRPSRAGDLGVSAGSAQGQTVATALLYSEVLQGLP